MVSPPSQIVPATTAAKPHECTTAFSAEKRIPPTVHATTSSFTAWMASFSVDRCSRSSGARPSPIHLSVPAKWPS